ncbi:MAG TPA: hypothetical protein VGF45_00990, partial [Polyangia bacterium]
MPEREEQRPLRAQVRAVQGERVANQADARWHGTAAAGRDGTVVGQPLCACQALCAQKIGAVTS